MNRREFSQLVAGAAFGQALVSVGAQAVPAPAVPTAAKFHFSVMIWTLGNKLPLERRMEIVAAAGYQGVELTQDLRGSSIEDLRRIKAKMRALGLICDSIGGLKVTLADPAGSSKLIAQLANYIPLAKELECPQILLTSGKRMEDLSREAQHSACIENLKPVADLAQKNNMQIVIEPIDLLEQKTGYLNSVTEAFEIVRTIGNPHLKVLYDFYHEQRGAGNLIEKLEQNIDWVGLVHVADVPGRHEPGTGEIDYLNIYRKLAELHYDKFITMEYYPTGDPTESLKTARLVTLQATRTAPAPYSLRSV